MSSQPTQGEVAGAFPPLPSTASGRWGAFAFGLLAYGGFLAVFAYTIGFVSDLGVSRSIDAPVRSSPAVALAVDLGLLFLFGLQHSVMARPAFKRAWTRLVPRPVERSTYVLTTCLVLALFYWQWRPIEAVVWSPSDPVLRVSLRSLSVCGWLLVLIATALINHADLFGLRQVWTCFRRRHYFPPAFVSPGPYNIIRHPLYLGWILAFWATPHMTAGHLLFALFMTAYVRLAIAFEERDLLGEHGRKYREYRERVPMLVPFARWVSK